MDRIEQLQIFLKEKPNDCFLKHALALEYVKKGDDQQARKLFEENRDYDASYVPTYYHLGQLLERIDEPDEAARIYEQGMEQAKQAQDNHSYSELRSVYDELLY